MSEATSQSVMFEEMKDSPPKGKPRRKPPHEAGCDCLKCVEFTAKRLSPVAAAHSDESLLEKWTEGVAITPHPDMKEKRFVVEEIDGKTKKTVNTGQGVNLAT